MTSIKLDFQAPQLMIESKMLKKKLPIYLQMLKK